MSLTVTALYGAILCALTIFLGLRVSLGRMARIDAEPLRRRVRVHGNLTENAALFVVMLGVAEVSGGSRWVLHTLGAGFVVARGLHAVGLGRSAGRSVPRFAGMASTWALLGLVAAYALWNTWG